ncbi:hypothetical protein ABC382_22660 [Lysinibacillus sp. 1P01SD]
MSTEQFLVLCKECGLTHDDLETMTFGMCLDYIDEYLKTKNPDNKMNSKIVEYAEEVPWL